MKRIIVLTVASIICVTIGGLVMNFIGAKTQIASYLYGLIVGLTTGLVIYIYDNQ